MDTPRQNNLKVLILTGSRDLHRPLKSLIESENIRVSDDPSEENFDAVVLDAFFLFGIGKTHLRKLFGDSPVLFLAENEVQEIYAAGMADEVIEIGDPQSYHFYINRGNLINLSRILQSLNHWESREFGKGLWVKMIERLHYAPAAGY